MSIINQIKRDEPQFKGIAVNDAVPLENIIELGVTMAWVISIDNPALIYDKILIAGNDKKYHPCYHPRYNTNKVKECQGCHDRIYQKGEYFIADIEKIVRCEDYMVETNGYGDESFRKHHCFKFEDNKPLKPDLKTGKYWEENKPRYAVYIKNPTEIKNFSSTNFHFLRNPILYFE